MDQEYKEFLTKDKKRKRKRHELDLDLDEFLCDGKRKKRKNGSKVYYKKT